jgi:sigma-B regulation protein RsbU (phosphoserine phosphatase)
MINRRRLFNVAERVLGLQQRVHRLEALLPTCSYCRKVQDARTDTWTPLETYITQRTETSFSHGVCPACMDGVTPHPSADPDSARETQ